MDIKLFVANVKSILAIRPLLTYQEIADGCNMKLQRVKDAFVYSKSEPTLVEAMSMAKYLGYSVDDLLTKEVVFKVTFRTPGEMIEPPRRRGPKKGWKVKGKVSLPPNIETEINQLAV